MRCVWRRVPHWRMAVVLWKAGSALALTDTQLAQFARLKSEVLDAIVTLVENCPDEYFLHPAAYLELAKKLSVPGAYTSTIHHDARGRVGKVKHAPAWETLRGRTA